MENIDMVKFYRFAWLTTTVAIIVLGIGTLYEALN